MTLNEQTRVILALLQIPSLGAQRIRLLLSHVDQPSDIFSMGRKRLLGINGFGEKIIASLLSFDDWENIDDILERTQRIGAELLSFLDPRYPTLLKEIPDPPLLLWVLGNLENLQKDAMAVIGTRKPGKYGRLAAEQFTRDLVQNNAVIVSGLAYGIDTIAHKTCVDSGGRTIAVLGSGIDWIYPTANTSLARDILAHNGTIISEFLPGTKPDAGNFPVRNRIVSGLSRGVLVIESGTEGGSMITARIALEQNKEVFAVPHQIQNPAGTGCNILIRDGQAKLVQSVADIFSEMSLSGFFSDRTNFVAAQTSQKWETMKEELDELSLLICQQLSESTLHIDALAEKLNKRPDELAIALLELEFKGCIKPLAGKMFALS